MENECLHFEFLTTGNYRFRLMSVLKYINYVLFSVWPVKRLRCRSRDFRTRHSLKRLTTRFKTGFISLRTHPIRTIRRHPAKELAYGRIFRRRTGGEILAKMFTALFRRSLPKTNARHVGGWKWGPGTELGRERASGTGAPINFSRARTGQVLRRSFEESLIVVN